MNNAILIISFSTGLVILALIGIGVLLHTKYRRAKEQSLESSILCKVALCHFDSGQRYLEWYRKYHEQGFNEKDFAHLLHLALSSRLLAVKSLKEMMITISEISFFHDQDNQEEQEHCKNRGFLISKAINQTADHLQGFYRHHIKSVSSLGHLDKAIKLQRYHEVKELMDRLRVYGITFPTPEEILKPEKETQPS